MPTTSTGQSPPVPAASKDLRVQGSAANPTRITVDGETNTNFLEVTVKRPGARHVLAWERVAYDSQP